MEIAFLNNNNNNNLKTLKSVMISVQYVPQVPARMEKLIAEKQFYAAVQLHVQSTLMLEREGLQTVGSFPAFSSISLFISFFFQLRAYALFYTSKIQYYLW